MSRDIKKILICRDFEKRGSEIRIENHRDKQWTSNNEISKQKGIESLDLSKTI